MSIPEIRGMPLLSLTLLVARIGADHPHDAVAADDLAVLTDAADAGSDFHDGIVGFEYLGLVCGEDSGWGRRFPRGARPPSGRRARCGMGRRALSPIDRRCAPWSGRRATSRASRDPREGCG